MHNTLDHILHTTSLNIAIAYHMCNDAKAKAELIEAYRNVRRAITIGENGKRLGAREAYEAMQGLNLQSALST